MSASKEQGSLQNSHGTFILVSSTSYKIKYWMRKKLDNLVKCTHFSIAYHVFLIAFYPSVSAQLQVIQFVCTMRTFNSISALVRTFQKRNRRNSFSWLVRIR